MTILGLILFIVFVVFILWLINACFDNPRTRNILRAVLFVLAILIALNGFGVLPGLALGTSVRLR